MNARSDSATRTTRAEILREAGRILAVSFLGWAAGAAVVWGFGRGSLQDDVGPLVAGAVLWAAVPLAILRVRRHRAGSPQTRRPRTWGIWFLLASFTGSAIIGIVRPATESWSSLQIWSAIFLLTPLGIALDTVPRLIRPAGWTSIRTSTPRAVPVTLLSVSLGAFVSAVALADTVMRARQDVFPPVGGLPTELLIVATVLSLGAIVAFVAGLPLLAHGLVGLLFAGSSFIVQLMWLPVVGGMILVDRPLLAGSHVSAALALIVATAVIQVFRPSRATMAETALVDWLRAEAVLPEKPTVEGTATS
jgi:hypothetical protein